MLMSDIGYQTKVYSDIRYNVGLCALQSDIRRSDITHTHIQNIDSVFRVLDTCSSLITIEHYGTGLAGVDYGIVSTVVQNRCGICSHVSSRQRKKRKLPIYK